MHRVLSLLFLVLAAAAVAACDIRRQQELAPGIYELSHYEPTGLRKPAQELLDWEADKLCPSGFTITDQRNYTDDQARRWFVWLIDCNL